MKNTAIKILAWVGIAVFVAFGSVVLLAFFGGMKDAWFTAAILYGAAYLTWKYVLRKPTEKNDNKSSEAL